MEIYVDYVVIILVKFEVVDVMMMIYNLYYGNLLLIYVKGRDVCKYLDELRC